MTMKDNNIIETSFDRTAYKIAIVTIIIPLYVGVVFLLSANDGSVPIDWYKKEYYRKLIGGMTMGTIAITGLACSLANVYSIIKLAIKNTNNKWMYVLNLINPIISIVLLFVSSALSDNMP